MYIEKKILFIFTLRIGYSSQIISQVHLNYAVITVDITIKNIFHLLFLKKRMRSVGKNKSGIIIKLVALDAFLF